MTKARDYEQRVAWAIERGVAAEKALHEKRTARLAEIADLPDSIQKLIAGQDLRHRRLYGRDLPDDKWGQVVSGVRAVYERTKR